MAGAQVRPCQSLPFGAHVAIAKRPMLTPCWSGGGAGASLPEGAAAGCRWWITPMQRRAR